jgi:hypothetical protein
MNSRHCATSSRVVPEILGVPMAKTGENYILFFNISDEPFFCLLLSLLMSEQFVLLGARLQKVHIRLCPIKALPIEPMQFCVALHRKLRIRLHPSMEPHCGIASILDDNRLCVIRLQ